MRAMKRWIAASLLLLLPACATVQSGGFDIPASFAEREFPKLKNRASFDLDCPAEQLAIATLNVYSTPGGNYPSEVGVKGCGRKAVYNPKNEAWFLNGGPFHAADADAPKVVVNTPAAPPAGQ
jgi:hypothetical protein